jgi:histidyl-tRNA synthetase
MKQREVKVSSKSEPVIFLAQLGDVAKIKALELMNDLRKANIPTAQSFDKDSLTAQLKIANKLQVKHTLIIGEEEASNNMLIIRNMKTGKQTLVKIEKAIKEIKKKL